MLFLIFRLISAFLSAIGSLFIIFSYIKFQKLRQFTYKLAFYLAISNFLSSISVFFVFTDVRNNEKLQNLCLAQGYLQVILFSFFFLFQLI